MRDEGRAGPREAITSGDGIDPPNDFPDYVGTRLRTPKRPLAWLPLTLTEITGPLLGPERVRPEDADLTIHGATGSPIGQRIVVSGQVRDSDGRPVRDSLVEVWQANSAGRYAHDADDHDAPLDPNFTGLGRIITDHQGRYRFVSIQPGAYPWRNHHNAWRPAHIHFSLFGDAFGQRLVTQMYFPGDPLQRYDPILNSIPDTDARQRLVARFDPEETVPEWALAYRWDIVLRGRGQTPLDHGEDHA